MKRRILSFVTTLALCLNLCPVWAFAADGGTDDGLTADGQQQVDLSPGGSLRDQPDGTDPAASDDGPGGSAPPDEFYILKDDFGYDAPYDVWALLRFDTAGYIFTGKGSPAIRVNGTGELYLTGTVEAPNGDGVEGSFLLKLQQEIFGRFCVLPALREQI